MIASFFARRRARHRLATELAIYYHSDYASEALSETARAAGIDAFRGETLVGTLAREGLLRPGDLRVPRPVSLPSLRLVHSESYLESVTRPEILARIFGLPEESTPVAALLRAQRLAAGGTVRAARHLMRSRRTVAVNLGGGFHHAEPEQGSGFCVYNDIATAIRVLRAKGRLRRAAIIDLDYHQGNGNLVAFAEDEEVLTLSVHGSVWTHVEAVANFSLELPTGTGDEAYLAALDEAALPALERFDPELVFYIAGNDVLAGDKLGDFSLTLEGVLARDRRVIDCCERLGTKLLITLGGGYQPAAVVASARLLRFLLSGKTQVRVRSPEDPRQRFRRIFRSIEPGRLQSDSSDAGGLSGLDFSDVLEDLSREPPARRFLDFYTLPGLEYALESYGILEQIREQGFRDLHTTGDLRDRTHQIVRIHGVGRDDPERMPQLLVELVAYRAEVDAPLGVGADDDEHLHVLWVEWLLLQNPLANFSLARPNLPGQEHPGLGISAEILLALMQVCRRLDLDGLLHRPAHYHNAAVGSRHFRFLDPQMEGHFRALREVLGKASLQEATEAVDEGRVRFGDGTPLVWDAAHFYLPVSKRLHEWFGSEPYRTRSREAQQALLGRGLHVVARAED